MSDVEHEVVPMTGIASLTGRQRLEAWLALPPGDRAELLSGRIVYKAMPSIEHGDAIMGVGEQIGRFRGPPGGGNPGGWWLSQEVDLFIAGQGLRPDICGWRIDKHPTPPRRVRTAPDGRFGVYLAAPDWVCEVLSSSTRDRDESEGIKWRTYHDAGVGHYWIVDLVREELTVYKRGERSYEAVEIASREACKALPPFESIQFDASRVFILSGIRRTEP